MTKKAYNIKIVKRNRSTGEKLVSIVPENIAKAIYGDFAIDTVITCGKIDNISMGDNKCQ